MLPGNSLRFQWAIWKRLEWWDRGKRFHDSKPFQTGDWKRNML
jgi:hypothetical protein